MLVKTITDAKADASAANTRTRMKLPPEFIQESP
jgi:hypothetical protein